MTAMTTTSKPMNPDDKAAAMRAARGPIARPTDRVPMGIRYLNVPTPPAAPAAPRPVWAELAVVSEIVDVDEGPRRRKPARRAPVRRAAPAPPEHRTRTRTAAAPATPPTAATAPVPAAPRVLSSYDAYACQACGSRYRYPADDHGCGRLTPVTVTIAAGEHTTTVGARVLASYAAHQCETCGDRHGDPVDGHSCGPLTPVTVTITAREHVDA